MLIGHLPAFLVCATVICVFLMRWRAVSVKLGCEVVLLVAIGLCLIASGTSPLPTVRQLAQNAEAPWLRTLAVLWWLIGARMVATLTLLALGRDARSRQARLFSDLLAGAIYLAVVLIILNSVLNLPVNGLLATSGVIAVVLGLALQNTLADVFSGIAVGVEHPFHVGDRIEIRDHAEGVVVEMNWRSVRICTDGEDVAIIPNSIVARAQIINRSVPSERRVASVEIETRSTEPAEMLMGLVHQAVLLCPAILPDPAPTVLITHVGVRKTTLGVKYVVATTPMVSQAKSQLLRQVRRLFRHAGVGDVPKATPISLLRDLPLFKSLDAEQIEALADHAVRRTFRHGEAMIRQGSLGSSLYIVEAGIFEIRQMKPDGEDLAKARKGPGEYFGDITMMSGDPSPATVRALSSASVFELPHKALEGLLHDQSVSDALEKSVERNLHLLDRGEVTQPEASDRDGALLQKIWRGIRFWR